MCGNTLDTIHTIFDCVQKNHLKPASLDDKLSEKLFMDFIDALDPDKLFFYDHDIVALEKYKYSLDDALKSGTLEFKREAVNLVRLRIVEAISMVERQTNTLTENDLYSHYAERAATTLEKKQRWKNHLTTGSIESYFNTYSKMDTVAFNVEKKVWIEKTKRHILKNLNILLKRTDNDWTTIYVNTYLNQNDNQSSYLTSAEKRKWDESFTREFIGIGIEFDIPDEFPIIRNITSGGPASKTDQIAIGDIILAIADSAGVLQDAADRSNEEITEMLSGAEGSLVTLKLLKQDREQIVVDLSRASIAMPRLTAYSITQKSDSTRIGYLQLPRFYEGDHLCSQDFSLALQKLNELSISKLILDLRDNQGGSAREAIKIMGYFLEGGIVMQAHYAEGTWRTFTDPDSTALFQGQLVVLVNENTGSASELFAGTMQDYGRAIVIGSQTYGKGTIQRFFELNDQSSDIGEVKLTIGNFYTAGGKSIQYKGITPDLILPSTTDSIPTGERAFRSSLRMADLEKPNLKRQFPSELCITEEYQKEVNTRFADIIAIAHHKKTCGPKLNIPVDLAEYTAHCDQCLGTLQSINAKTGLVLERITTTGNMTSIEKTDMRKIELEEDRVLRAGFDLIAFGK